MVVKRKGLLQLSKYSVVAICAALMFWGIYSAVFFTTSDPIWLAVGYYFATAIAITISFTANKHFTFANKGKIKRQYVYYIIFYATVAFALSYFVFAITTAGIHGMLAGFFARAITVTADFFFFKFVLFRNKPENDLPESTQEDTIKV